MRLSENTKLLLLRNIDLVKYINENGLDMDKLKKCNIERFGTNCYVFGLSKKKPDSVDGLFDIGIASNPDIVLVLNVDDGKITIESTDKTRELLSLNAEGRSK